MKSELRRIGAENDALLAYIERVDKHVEATDRELQKMREERVSALKWGVGILITGFGALLSVLVTMVLNALHIGPIK